MITQLTNKVMLVISHIKPTSCTTLKGNTPPIMKYETIYSRMITQQSL